MRTTVPPAPSEVRGSPNLGRRDDRRGTRRGIVTASTGNHGQSIGLASRIHGVQCTVFVPGREQSRQERRDARLLARWSKKGGKDFDEARERCEERARRTGARYVHSARRAAADRRRRHLRVRKSSRRSCQHADVIFVPLGGAPARAA